MAHLEMAVSGSAAAEGGQDPAAELDHLARTTVDHWADAVDAAIEPCLVVNDAAVIAAASLAACHLLGFGSQEEAVGKSLYDGVLPLVDFTAAASALPETELGKVPAFQALSTARLARGLLRVRRDAEVLTIDAVATPLLEGDRVVGALSFFCLV